MQVLRRAAFAMLFALPLVTLPVTAQFYKWDFNVNGGFSWLSGDILDRSDFDFDEFEDPILNRNSVDLGSGGTVGSQLGYWFTKRIGLRANFAYTDSDVDRNIDVLGFPLLNLFDHDVNLWSGTGDLMVRLNTPRTRWDGFEWLPYIALGAGAQWINPSGDRFFVVDDIDIDLDPDDDLIFNTSGHSGIPLRCSDFLDTCAFLEEKSTFMGLVGLGMDLRFAPSFAVRLEVTDRIWEAPVKEVIQDDIFPFVFAEVGDLGKTVNQISLTVGASYLFGLREPPRRVVVAPPPRPAPPPPPPPPSTEEITVCMIDPMFAGGVRNVTATRNLSTGDTTIMKNGDKVRLSDAVANIPVVSGSPWYVSGAPFEIGTAPNRLLYVSVGGARMIEPSDLAYLGTVNGLPVFADRLTLSPGLTNLGPNTDLNRIVVESADARHALEQVAVIYVPLQPTGCVFQALQKQVEVRKK
ncbi:MAG: hypothetical protein ACRENP_01760 [Longimicrobiales bacterium]